MLRASSTDAAIPVLGNKLTFQCVAKVHIRFLCQLLNGFIRSSVNIVLERAYSQLSSISHHWLALIMNSWTFTRRGHTEDVLQLRMMPVPDSKALKHDELLIKVSHAALQPFGYILTWAVPMFLRKNPSIPELDFSGRVVAKGKDVTQNVGDDVFGVLSPGSHIKQGRGTLADYVVVLVLL